MQPDLRWITPTGHLQPIPAWRNADGWWLLAAIPKIVPAGSTAHALIEAAAPRTCARCSAPIVDVDNVPTDDTALCRACGDPDSYSEDIDEARARTLRALRALQHLEMTDGIPEVADMIAGLICDLSDALGEGPDSPANDSPAPLWVVELEGTDSIYLFHQEDEALAFAACYPGAHRPYRRSTRSPARRPPR